MANEITVEQFKLRLAIWRDAIPIYEGGTKLLSHFLQTCDKFAENLATNDNALNVALFALIKSRIRGEALDLVVANNPETYANCRALLVSRYSDPSSEDLLLNKLSSCYQHTNQSYEKYADEVKVRLNKLKEFLQLNIADQATKNIKNTLYENLAKNTFINGIKEPYHSHLINFELNDIEACLVKCRKFDNHEQQAAYLNFARQRDHKPKQNSLTEPRRVTPLPTFGNPRNNNSFSNPGPSRNPSPFSFQPRPAATQTQQSFNATNFGNNNFARNYNNNNNNNNLSRTQNYQPTPMSINTRNSNRPSGNQPIRTNNIFRSTGPANFIAEELHCQQEQNEECEIAQQDEMPSITGENINLEDREALDEQNFHQPADSNDMT